MADLETHTELGVESEFPRPVRIRDQTGRIGELSAILEGSCCVVLYVPDAADERAIKSIQFLEALQLPRDIKRQVLLSAASPGRLAAQLSDFSSELVVAQDALAELSQWHKPVYFFIDKTWKVQGVFPIGKERRDLAASILAYHRRFESLLQSPHSVSAPVLIVPNVLSKAFCGRLMDHFEQRGGHPSGVLDLSTGAPQWRPDPAIKARRDLTLEDSNLIRVIEQAVAQHILGKIRQAFHYQVTHHEPFKLVCYDPNKGYFRPHRDNETPDTSYRRFAMTINLNTGSYQGGVLYFPEYGNVSYRPEAGAAIVFSCSLLHEASDVSAGHRYAVLGFFYNPNDGL